MLSLQNPAGRPSRREFLRIGSLALGGLSLSSLLPLRTAFASPAPPVTGRSVVFLFMHGGPSQTETFDPKMTAPPGVCSATGEVSTTIPGVTFGGTFPRLAALADKLAVIRSFVTGDGNHDIKPIVGRDTFGANLGSLYARVAGPNDPRTGMPTNAALYPNAVDPSTRPANMSFGQFDSPGSLGGAYRPFVPGSGGNLQQDMQLAIAPERLDDRRFLLDQLDRARWLNEALDGAAGVDNLRQQAFDTLLGGVADAFDLAREDAATIERYDTAPLVRPDQIDRKWNNYDNYVDNAKSLGKLMLLARRLCEAGCGFVTVTTNFVWDMHADQNNAGVAEGMRYMGLPFDHAVSAFIEDVEARGLSERILLVACGEMGRTPKINAHGGRDHWGGLAPLLLAGGGLKMGQVVGQSTRDAGEPLSEPITIRHLVATILNQLVDGGELRLRQGIPREIVQAASDWPVIGELV